MLKRVSLNANEKEGLSIARIAFMNTCPFYAQLMIEIGELVPTRDLPTAATDGKRIYYNPDYFITKCKPQERVFILAHETSHLVKRHPTRFKHYKTVGKLRDLPWVEDFGNICADYVINAELIQAKIGACNPNWLYRKDVLPGEIWEDVYERLAKPGSPGNGKGQGNSVQTYGQNGGGVRGQQGDEVGGAPTTGRGFDVVLEPGKDPQTGMDDLPDEAEFLEAVARAYATAKAMGNVPGFVQRIADELLAPKVDWREHIRMLVTGKIGSRHETWSRPNRRRLVTNPIVIIPGKRGYGAERVVVGFDTSGSMSDPEIAAGWAEIGGILNDCKPREIVIIGCDTRVTHVHTVSTLDEFDVARLDGLGGGGGTRFEPVFEYIREHDLRPETMIYLTDMHGSFPIEAPGYPVIWAATTDQQAPFGEVVRIKLEE